MPVAVILIVSRMVLIVMAVAAMVVAVLMRVIMTLMMIVVMIMAMMVPVIMMMVGKIMPMRATVVGLERGHHHRRRKPALSQQLRKVGMRQHAQAVGEDLDGNVTVAQRQQETSCLGKILLAHLQHRLDVGHDVDEISVVEHQAIIGAQERRGREIEFDASPLTAEREALLLCAVLELEQQRVDDFPGAAVGGAENFLGARHGGDPKFQWRVDRSLSPAPGSNGTTDDGRSGLTAASTLPASTFPASTLLAASARASRRT